VAGSFADAVGLIFEDQGREDYTSRLKTDRKMLARINKPIEDVSSPKQRSSSSQPATTTDLTARPSEHARSAVLHG
jgi:hypothetical protein